MMKKRILIGMLGVLLAVGLTACEEAQTGGESPAVTEEPEDTLGTDGSESPSDGEEDAQQLGGQEQSGEDSEDGPVSIRIYHVNEETGELESAETELEKLDGQAVWEELKKAGVAAEDTAVLGFTHSAEDGSMILDLNAAFGEQLRGMGTTGEKELIEAVVQTYLEAFQCDRILLTEEGGELRSSHKAYDDYLEKE